LLLVVCGVLELHILTIIVIFLGGTFLRTLRLILKDTFLFLGYRYQLFPIIIRLNYLFRLDRLLIWIFNLSSTSIDLDQPSFRILTLLCDAAHLLQCRKHLLPGPREYLHVQLQVLRYVESPAELGTGRDLALLELLVDLDRNRGREDSTLDFRGELYQEFFVVVLRLGLLGYSLDLLGVFFLIFFFC
jgi:hypothetical protein